MGPGLQTLVTNHKHFRPNISSVGERLRVVKASQSVTESASSQWYSNQPLQNAIYFDSV